MPQPDLSALKDDIGTLPLADDFLPAVMQALHYYTEMMQYEQVKNPASSDSSQPNKTTKRPVAATTTRRPYYSTTTTRRPATTTTTKNWKTTTTRRKTPQTTWRQPTTSRTTRWTTTPRTTTVQRTTQRTTTRRNYYTSTTRRPTNYQDFPFTTQINIWRKFLLPFVSTIDFNSGHSI